jgi:hypothetical protein
MKILNDSELEKLVSKVPVYDPKKAYPRLRHKIWRDLEAPGPVRYLTKEEIEREYRV